METSPVPNPQLCFCNQMLEGVFWFLLGNSRHEEKLFLGFPAGPTESEAAILMAKGRRDHDGTQDDRGEKKASEAAFNVPASAFHHTVRF